MLLLIAAQVVIGSALGAQFRPEFLTRLFGLLWASCLVVLFAAGSMALFGAAIAWAMGYPVPTMMLGHGARRHRRDGAHRQGAGARFDHDRRLPADAHRHRADLDAAPRSSCSGASPTRSTANQRISSQASDRRVGKIACRIVDGGHSPRRRA